MENKATNENLLDAETREKLAGRVEVLDKVKKLFLLPQLEMITVAQIADYYGVDKEAIQKCYQRNKDEIDLDGVEKFYLSTLVQRLGQNVQSVKTKYHTDFMLSDTVTLRVPNGGIRLFPKRAILRIGMLLRDSEVAREVRTQLLNVFEKTDDSQKIEAIETEQEIMGQMGIAFANGDLTAFCEAAMQYNAFKQRHIDRLEAKISADKPKVEFAETFGSGKETVSVGTYAKMLYDKKGIDIGRNRLFSWLRRNGIVDSKNIPYQKYMNAGWFRVVSIQKPGINQNIPTARITAKGQEKLFELISEDYKEA